MKNAKLIGVFFLAAALAAAVTGCKHTSMVTPIPGLPQPSARSSQETPGGTALTPPEGVRSTPEGIGFDPTSDFFKRDMNEDREKFKTDTVYFELDSATIKASEESKLQHIADYFKGNQKDGLIIEGNCDERGTEKYNLSLGERRALAAREYLANLGVNPQHIKTVTYGKSRPIDPGHNEAAWKQNRRDEFILATPK